MNITDRTYDPETITILRAALDDAWASMSASQQALTTRSALAVRLLSLAARGERDPVRLRAHALGVVDTEGLQLGYDPQAQQTV
jgi:hypothetical protein